MANCNNHELGANMIKLFDNALAEFNFDRIVIENQIGKNAIKMKTIQGMISMYFLMKGYAYENIVAYNATHKLKYWLKNKKTKYDERKKLSKQIVSQLCKEYYNDDLNVLYMKNKKKDDLADCLLQGLDYLCKTKTIEPDYISCVNISV